LICADLHFHTYYSSDASIQPKAIVERLNQNPTVKALAITDHNTTEGYEQVRKLAEPYEDIIIIPGVEISAEEGEIILLGIKELPPKPWKTQNLTDHAHKNNALAIAPHPYRGLGLKDQIRNLNIDAIEILNAITSPEFNKKAEQLARAQGLPGVSGSDVHAVGDPWNVYTEINAEPELNEILEAIKKGKVRVFQTDKSIRF
jgi:predicted metal-dependent phosphoesterase TrpH